MGEPFPEPREVLRSLPRPVLRGTALCPRSIQGTLQYYDHDFILGGILAPPSQVVLNGLHPRLGKLVEIGTIYTTVAGLLNILAIYDAYEGPAYLEEDEEQRQRRKSSPALIAAGELKPEGSA